MSCSLLVSGWFVREFQIANDSRYPEIVDGVANGLGQVRDIGRHGFVGEFADERQFHIEFAARETVGTHFIYIYINK